MSELPISSMEKLLKKAGAKRVSESSKKEILAKLIKKTGEIIPRAQQFAEHANRKTIKKQDIYMALNL